MISVSSSLSVSAVSPVPQSAPAKSDAAQTTAVPTATAVVESPAPVEDDSSNVTLSQLAQVQQLTAEGEDASQIAGILGISIASVYSELGIAPPVSSTATPTETTAAPSSSQAVSFSS
jgi:hypothetical protein